MAQHVILREGALMPHTISGITFYTTREIASKLAREPRTIQRWIREGRLKAAKDGRGYIISESEINSYTKSLIEATLSGSEN